MKRKILGLVLVVSLLLVGCNSNGKDTKEASVDKGEIKTLTCLAGMTPHAEILESIKEPLEKEGIKLDIVSKQWDATWNEQVQNGTVDFHYDAYVPYLDEWNEKNGGDLVGAGSIHMEPLVMTSEKYDSLEKLPDNAKIAIKEDVTNQYRCLKLLEQAGLVKLSKDITLSNADISYIEKYNKPLEVIAIDADVIMNTKGDFDAYITNTNRLLEAGLDPLKYMAREKSEDSTFGNVICVKKENENKEEIKKLVSVLQTEEVKKFIEEKYKGAVIPAF